MVTHPAFWWCVALIISLYAVSIAFAVGVVRSNKRDRNFVPMYSPLMYQPTQYDRCQVCHRNNFAWLSCDRPDCSDGRLVYTPRNKGDNGA